MINYDLQFPFYFRKEDAINLDLIHIAKLDQNGTRFFYQKKKFKLPQYIPQHLPGIESGFFFRITNPMPQYYQESQNNSLFGVLCKENYYTALSRQCRGKIKNKLRPRFFFMPRMYIMFSFSLFLYKSVTPAAWGASAGLIDSLFYLFFFHIHWIYYYYFYSSFISKSIFACFREHKHDCSILKVKLSYELFYPRR